MSSLLAKLRPLAHLPPGRLADQLGDHDFNGTATPNELGEFLRLLFGAFGNKAASPLRMKRSEGLLALFRIADLPRSNYYPKLNVAIVVYQAAIRLLRPARIDQKEFGLCGPAHFALMMLKTVPEQYVKMVCELLERGRTSSPDGTEVVPNPHVTAFDPGQSIAQADWLIAGTLRNLDKAVPAGEKRGAYGGTQGPDVFRYCVQAGYKRVIANTAYEKKPRFLLDRLAHATVVLSSSYENYHPADTRAYVRDRLGYDGNVCEGTTSIHLACDLVRQGWRVLLKINSEWAAYVARDPVASASDKVPLDMVPPGPERDRYLQVQLAIERRALDKDIEDLIAKLKAPRTVMKVLPVGTANHWVLAKTLTINAGMLHATIYTWGGKRAPVAVPVDAFVQAYSGFVAAMG
ncbi:MAG TPA: hypothetical protein VEO54_04235 [Thermoanaerobaculia bacterium]|nr:hypothetical protein [Thermoanaerobaculia bacterium]